LFDEVFDRLAQRFLSSAWRWRVLGLPWLHPVMDADAGRLVGGGDVACDGLGSGRTVIT
jgi:hypothetical protein